MGAARRHAARRIVPTDPSAAPPPAVLRRQLVLLLALAGCAAAAFAATRALAAGNAEIRRQDARTLYARAQADLRAGRAGDATTALRAATAKDPANLAYRLALARTLAEGQRDDEARRVLLDLRDAQPEDADTNLELARLEARHDPAAARRFYQSALAALWPPEAAPRRRSVRVELIEFLLRQHDRSRALSELLLLSAGLPDEPAAHDQVGRMYLEAGDSQRALAHFSAALRAAPDDAGALAGAARSAFALGDYVAARRYVSRLAASDPELELIREVSQRVVNDDPLARGIAMPERLRRLRADGQRAQAALARCAAATSAVSADDAAALDAMTADPPPRARPRLSRDDLEEALDRVYRVELAVDRACGATTAADRALLVIGRRHQEQ
jgi:tetratricopeptide (TPR) repeat protein